MSSKGGLNSVFCSLNFVSSNISFHNTQLDRFSVHGSIRDTNVFEPHYPKMQEVWLLFGTTIAKIKLSPLLTDIQPIT